MKNGDRIVCNATDVHRHHQPDGVSLFLYMIWPLKTMHETSTNQATRLWGEIQYICGGWLFAVFFCCYSWNQTSFYSKWIDFFVRYLEMLSKMPWQPTEKRNTNKRWSENNQPHNGRNKIDTGLICSMKCPLKQAKWIWMNFELIRSVTVLEKRQLFIAQNAETKYLIEKKRSKNIARKGRRKLTKNMDFVKEVNIDRNLVAAFWFSFYV